MRDENLGRLSTVQTNYNDPYYLHLSYIFEALRGASEYVHGRVIDLGCGNKPYRELFPAVTEYFGCDVVQSSNTVVDLICDVTDVPLDDDSFDTAFSSQVIEHVSKPQNLCNEAYRLLRKGGYFVLAGPMYWHLHEEPYDFYRFTKHGFKHLLEEAGFEVVKITANGGKWAMVGLVAIHGITGTRFQRPFVIRSINKIFGWADKRAYDEINTSNYVIVARK